MDWAKLLLDYVKPELLVIIPILWYIGKQLKASRKIKDWAIPFILMAISILLVLPYILIFEGPSMAGIWIGVIQSLVVWAIEGQAYQTLKQIKEKT
jgi:hypothetical protein